MASNVDVAHVVKQVMAGGDLGDLEALAREIGSRAEDSHAEVCDVLDKLHRTDLDRVHKEALIRRFLVPLADELYKLRQLPGIWMTCAHELSARITVVLNEQPSALANLTTKARTDPAALKSLIPILRLVNLKHVNGELYDLIVTEAVPLLEKQIPRNPDHVDRKLGSTIIVLQKFDSKHEALAAAFTDLKSPRRTSKHCADGIDAGMAAEELRLFGQEARARRVKHT